MAYPCSFSRISFWSGKSHAVRGSNQRGNLEAPPSLGDAGYRPAGVGRFSLGLVHITDHLMWAGMPIFFQNKGNWQKIGSNMVKTGTKSK